MSEEIDARNWIAKHLFEINPETDFFEGDLIHPDWIKERDEKRKKEENERSQGGSNL